jgi:hypothetical protein
MYTHTKRVGGDKTECNPSSQERTASSSRLSNAASICCDVCSAGILRVWAQGWRDRGIPEWVQGVTRVCRGESRRCVGGTQRCTGGKGVYLQLLYLEYLWYSSRFRTVQVKEKSLSSASS